MPIVDAYRTDLAYIHDAGHGSIAADAARKLIKELTRGGFREGTVVDLGCGSGILAAHLVRAGYQVLGIDISEAMVALAHAGVPDAKFRVGSFVSADLPVCVAVTAVGEVLNYGFDTANDNTARVHLFQRVHRALVPGGLLMFDIAGPDRKQPRRTFAEGSDWAVLVEADLETATGVLTRKITSFRQVDTLYRRDVEIHRLMLLDQATVLQSLRTAGFEAQVIPRYDALPLSEGIVPFLCRKLGVMPSNTTLEPSGP
jgi:SAM-dependent methyltransferase